MKLALYNNANRRKLGLKGLGVTTMDTLVPIKKFSNTPNGSEIMTTTINQNDPKDYNNPKASFIVSGIDAWK